MSFDKKRSLIQSLKEKKPEYADILGFYERISELQSAASPRLYLKLPSAEKRVIEIQEREGFPLISRDQFTIDIPAATALFESLCHVAKHSNEKMRETIESLEEALSINALRKEDLMKRFADEEYLDSVSRTFELDRTITRFLIHMSVYPSLRAHAEMLKDRMDMKKWLRGYCPICGSPPAISQLRDEGHRFYLCSFCGFAWPGERLKCPFCENTDHTKLHYFYAEGDEAHRVDLCGNCNQYIKTVDTRKLDYEPDLELEDIVTIHLDILASEKGYKRPAPSPWGI